MPLSLKWKIQLWYALILGILLLTLGLGFYFYEKEHQLTEIDQRLNQQINPLLGPLEHSGPNTTKRKKPQKRPKTLTETGADAGLSYSDGWQRRETGQRVYAPRPPEGSKPKPLDQPFKPLNEQYKAFEGRLVPRGYYAMAERKDQSLPPYQSSNFPNIEMPQGLHSGFFERFRGNDFRELYHERNATRVLVGVDLSNFKDALDALKLQILSALLGIYLICLSVGFFLVSRSVKPLQQIEHTSKKIASGELAERIPKGSKADAVEFTNLAENLNDTFSQLESLFKRQIRFTADASHELRTPLTALIAQIEHGLKRQRSEEDYAHILKICSRSTNRIRRITEQLIELSRYDSGRVEMDLEVVELQNLLTSLVEELTPFVEKQNCKLIMDLESGIVVCDPFRIEQVITNLVNNAIQHNTTPVTITIQSKIFEEGFAISVVDNGKGIHPENLDKLFDRFFQENDSRSKEENSNNVGLGLSISKAIVEAHNGTLTVNSKPGLKTTFEMNIPRR